MMSPGLVREPLPSSPRGFQVRCTWCRCSVSTTHEPGSLDCLDSATERTFSQADDD